MNTTATPTRRSDRISDKAKPWRLYEFNDDENSAHAKLKEEKKLKKRYDKAHTKKSFLVDDKAINTHGVIN